MDESLLPLVIGGWMGYTAFALIASGTFLGMVLAYSICYSLGRTVRREQRSTPPSTELRSARHLRCHKVTVD